MVGWGRARWLFRFWNCSRWGWGLRPPTRWGRCGRRGSSRGGWPAWRVRWRGCAAISTGPWRRRDGGTGRTGRWCWLAGGGAGNGGSGRGGGFAGGGAAVGGSWFSGARRWGLTPGGIWISSGSSPCRCIRTGCISRRWTRGGGWWRRRCSIRWAGGSSPRRRSCGRERRCSRRSGWPFLSGRRMSWWGRARRRGFRWRRWRWRTRRLSARRRRRWRLSTG